MDMPLGEPSGSSEVGNSEPSSPQLHTAVENALLENHQAFLKFLIRRLGDSDTAEDVLQQFYVRVLSRTSQLQAVESVVAWLYTVLRSVLVDHYRKESSHRKRNADYALMLNLAEDGWEEAEPRDRGCACLYKVLPTLRPEYSDVLRRVDLDETPPRRVAVDLGITANNVRVRLHRARQALRQGLLESCPDCAETGFQEYVCNEFEISASSAEQHRAPAT